MSPNHGKVKWVVIIGAPRLEHRYWSGVEILPCDNIDTPESIHSNKKEALAQLDVSKSSVYQHHVRKFNPRIDK